MRDFFATCCDFGALPIEGVPRKGTVTCAYQWQYDSVSAIQLSTIGADLPQAVWPVLEATWKGAKLSV
jgi:hypothetical protein